MRPIPGYPHSFADESGRIWSDRSGLLLAVPAFVSSGFLSVTIRDATGRRIAWVHRLVLSAHLGERAGDVPCFHGKKGIRCNAIDNLRVSASPVSLAEGCTLAEAARRCGVGRRSVDRIKARFTPKRYAQYRSGSTISDQAGPRAV